MFPVIPPIADTDPSIFEAVVVRLPAVMLAQRSGDSIQIIFPEFATTNLWVGHKMVTGITCEYSFCHDSVTQSLGSSLQGGLAFQSATNVIGFGPGGDPSPGREIFVELRMTMFETDLPAQHMWSPQSGKQYRVLWVNTFREKLK